MKKRGLNCGRLSFFEAVQSARSLADILAAVGPPAPSEAREQPAEERENTHIHAHTTAAVASGRSCKEIESSERSASNKRKRIEL